MSMTDNRRLFYGILIIVILAVIGIGLFAYLSKPVQTITNFEECVNAGYPIMESYPRQCKTSDGRVFREELTSGVSGKVLIGPQCPVVRVDDEERCKDKSYQATIIIKMRPPGSVLDEFPQPIEVARVTSDINGEFRIPLKPGTYILEPLSGDSILPHGETKTVNVEQDKFTEVTIHYDTGIR